MSRDKIYIGDLGYKVVGAPFPLGAGYIATMIDNYFNNYFETTIFIDPLEIIEALKKNPPKIIALANYSWNSNINSEIIKFSKKISKDIITVLGGPNFEKNDKKWLKGFFEYNRCLDFYVSGEGEWKFSQIVKTAIEYSYNTEKMKHKLSPDIFFKDHDGEIIQGDIPLQIALGSYYVDTRKKHLDSIKSPYISGRLDKFFEKEGMIPMIETVRGCPYSCTFCAWGDASLSRLSAFSEERVFGELDYIAARIGKSLTRLILADGNFGILKRDIEIARYLNEINKKYKWPQNIYLYFAKNSNDNIVKIASTLGKMIKVSLARQSMNPDVLKNIKRRNINDETFYKIQKELTKGNIESMVEIIYPLPGETKKTFVDGIGELFNKMDMLKTEIRFYPLELLPGSEVATTKSREKFGLKSAWRKLSGMDKNFGDVSCCEYQEIVISTNTFSLADFVYVRKLHFLICLFATYGIYQPIVELYQGKNKKNNFIWFLDKLIFAMSEKSNLMHEIYKLMEIDIHNELIPADKYRPDKPFEIGETKRMNIFYILKLLYDSKGKYRRAFSELIKKLFIENSLAAKEEIEKKLNEVEASIVDFVLIEKVYKSNDSSIELPKTYKNKSIVSEFMKTYNGNLISTLDSMYDLSSAGHLEKMLLKAHNVTKVME